MIHTIEIMRLRENQGEEYHRVVVAILSKSRGWSILSYSQSIIDAC